MAYLDSELTMLSDTGLKWAPIQAEILHAKVERTIQMNLFLPSAVCRARELRREVKQHMRCRETHERCAVLKLKT